MSFRVTRITIYLLFLCSSLLFKCTRYGVAGESNHTRIHPKDLQIPKKLGVAVLFPVHQKPFVSHDALIDIIKSVQGELEISAWSSQNHLEWIDTWLDKSPYDYSQDYRNGEKKNLIEIQVRFPNFNYRISYFLSAITILIIPSIVDYELNFSTIYYDESGKKYNLNTRNTITIREVRSLFFPLPFIVRGDAKDSVYKVLKAHILESYEEVIARNLSHSEFKNKSEPMDTPFRMKLWGGLSCEDKHTLDYGHASQDRIIFDNEKYLLCFTRIHFRKQIKKQLFLHTKDFWLITKNQKIPSIQKITADYSRVEGSVGGGFNARGVTRDLNRSLTLKPDDSGFGDFLEIRFLVPREEVHSIDSIRWEDKKQSDNPSDVWIGWGEGDDPQK
jgi:hypothetical protein